MDPLILDIVAVFFGVTFLAIGLNLAKHERKRFQSEKNQYPAFAKIQLIRRQSGASLIIIMGIMLPLGLVFRWTFTGTPEMFLLYWGTFSGFIFILLILAGWDWIAIRKEYRCRVRKQIEKILFEVPKDTSIDKTKSTDRNSKPDPDSN